MSAPSPLKVLPAEHSTEGIFDELKDIQRKHPKHYLPLKELERVAERRGLHLRDVHAIASYYPHFHLHPPATIEIKVCDDMSCHLRGAPGLQRTLEQRFQGISRDELNIGNVSCVGRCEHAPSFVINDRYYDGHTPEEAVEIVKNTMAGHPPPGSSYRVLDMRLESDPYGGQKPYSALREYASSRNWTGLIANLEAAGLKGMGGAGYPTNLKWGKVRKLESPQKYIICNADESEPGTLKDRFILTQLPHLVIEGMILGGLCVGAKRGYLYIRHEYEEQAEILIRELNSCVEQGLIGEGILGYPDLSFEIVVFVSPGGYICGEETALLEAIEGKRAEPRNKPPFVADAGLWQKPTVINNVETLAFATAIAAKGADWWKSHGANGAKGLKFVGVSGDVQKPGMYEVPMGIRYSDLIREYAGGPLDGRKIIGFAPSGPSSGYLPASMLDLPMDWDKLREAKSMVGSAAIVVCAEGRCMLDMAFNAVRFYRNESCGKCVPCRVGSQKMVEILHRWTQGRHHESDQQIVEELSHALRLGSICGLGQILPAPIQSVMQHFREQVDEHLLHHRCPAGVCFRGGKA
ncbi:MAG TPA: NADH-ubiquinone oxidoreductase-F iron-sulfur binding region domain-containing protein [Candidatus Angelobacter sp.]